MYEEITYDYFCALGGLGGHAGHRLHTKAVYNGPHFMFHTYWMRVA